MTAQDDSPSPPEGASLVLPRPNLGPEPWSAPAATSGALELGIGVALAIFLSVLAVRKWRRQTQSNRIAAGQLTAISPDSPGEQTPNHRLITSSAAVRSALIAEFGPTWSSRTTEEIARDPLLPERLGSETAVEVVAYLDCVDRAKFAGEEFSDVDEWISTAQKFLHRFPKPTAPARRPT